MFTIYRHIDGFNMETRYVGVTGNFADRWKCHISAAMGSNLPHAIWLWVRIKHGITAYMLSIEDVDDWSLACEREKYWIEYYRARGDRLFNVYPVNRSVGKLQQAT